METNNSTSPPPPEQEEDVVKALILESQKVVKSQPRRFLALFLLILTIPTIFTILYLIFKFPLLIINKISIFDHHLHPERRDDQAPSLSIAILLALSCFLFDSVFSSFAVGSITHLIFRSFLGQQGRVCELKSAIKPLRSSFFPLLATTLLLRTITAAIALLALAILVALAAVLGFHNIDVYSPSFFLLALAVALPLTSGVAYLLRDWSLGSVITPLEPDKWGFGSLKLSKSLICGKEKARLAFSISFCSDAPLVAILLMIWNFSLFLGAKIRAQVLSNGDELKYLWLCFGAVILISSDFISWIRILHIAARAAFYVHCKESFDDSHGHGLSAEVYVPLLVDDENV